MPQPKMRVAWEQVGTVTLINDAYNANPGSTRAAIELLQGTGTGRQRVIVLGTMRELGAASAQCHDDIAGLALASGQTSLRESESSRRRSSRRRWASA